MSDRRSRSVAQVLGVYAVASWGVFQVSLALRDGLGLPDNLPKYAAILLLIGLPIVLATAVVQQRLATRDTTLPHGLPLRMLTWKRSLLGGVGAFALLGICTTVFMGVRHYNTLAAQGLITHDDPVVLADFTSPQDSLLGVTVTEALRVDLQQSNVLRLAQPTQINAALAHMKRKAADGLPPDVASELAVREGLKGVITGSVSRLGAGYVLVAEVRATSPDSILASFRATANDSLGLIEAVNTLSKDMRGRIGESLKSIRAGTPLDRATTSSLPALQKYAEALRIQRETGDRVREIALLEEAVAIDSTFADAWRKLGVVYSNLGVRPDARRLAITKAYQLRDRLPEKEKYRVQASYATNVTLDIDAAIADYRKVLTIDGHDEPALNNLAVLLKNRRRFPEAEALLDTLVGYKWGNPTTVEWLNLVQVRFALGDIAGAKKTHASALQRLPNNASILLATNDVAVAEGSWDNVDRVAKSVADRFPENKSARADALEQRWRAAAIEGRLADCRKYLEELSELLSTIFRQQQLSALLQRADVMLANGDVAQAKLDLEDALKRVPLASLPEAERPITRVARLYAQTKQMPRADALLRMPRQDRAPDSISIALIDIERGKPERALQPLRKASETGACQICELDYLGHAYDAMGQQDSARALYERYLSLPDYWRVEYEAAPRPALLLRAAELHEAAGDKAMAVRRYTELLHLWRNADPVLEPRINTVRARLMALQGKG